MKVKQGWGVGLGTVFFFIIAPVTHIIVKSMKDIIFRKTGSCMKDSFTSDHFKTNEIYLQVFRTSSNSYQWT